MVLGGKMDVSITELSEEEIDNLIKEKEESLKKDCK